MAYKQNHYYGSITLKKKIHIIHQVYPKCTQQSKQLDKYDTIVQLCAMRDERCYLVVNHGIEVAIQ